MAEYALTGKWQKKHTWKMTEWKMHDTENGRTENGRMENAWHGTWQNGKCMIRNMAEITHTGKWQKIHTRKMTEQNMQDTENGRTENA